MSILYIHNEKRLKTGAHYINNLLVHQLRRMGNVVDTLYPQESINLFSTSLKGGKQYFIFLFLNYKTERYSKI